MLSSIKQREEMVRCSKMVGCFKFNSVNSVGSLEFNQDYHQFCFISSSQKLLVWPNWPNSSTGYRCHRPPTYLPTTYTSPLPLCHPTTTLSTHYHLVNPLPLCQPTTTLSAHYHFVSSLPFCHQLPLCQPTTTFFRQLNLELTDGKT